MAASFVAHYIVLHSHGILAGFLSMRETNSNCNFSQNVIFCERNSVGIVQNLLNEVPVEGSNLADFANYHS